jgi:NTE family protein
MMNHALILLSCGLCLSLLAGCASQAHYPENPPLKQFDGEHNISSLGLHDSGNTLLILTFSGGGSRAAALAYGVLEALAATAAPAAGRQQTLLDEVDMISSVSGGQRDGRVLRTLR